MALKHLQGRISVAALLAVSLMLVSARAWAQEDEATDELPASPEPSAACDGHGRTGWMVRESVIGLTNPLGGVVTTRVGYCMPLIRRPGVLYRLTAIEAGFFHFITPSFSRQGGYARLIPLSLLVLDVKVAGVWYWPLPGFRAAAHWDAGSPSFTWPSNGIVGDLSVEKEHGGGLNVTVSATVRASVTLGRLPAGDVELLVLDNLALDYWYFPGYDYYYNQRADTVLAEADFLIANSAALLVGLPLTRRVGLRFGATDSLGFVPIGGRLATHQVGGLLMFPVATAHSTVAEILPFVRVTYYTHSWSRQLSFAWNFLLGVDLAFRI